MSVSGVQASVGFDQACKFTVLPRHDQLLSYKPLQEWRLSRADEPCIPGCRHHPLANVYAGEISERRRGYWLWWSRSRSRRHVSSRSSSAASCFVGLNRPLRCDSNSELASERKDDVEANCSEGSTSLRTRRLLLGREVISGSALVPSMVADKRGLFAVDFSCTTGNILLVRVTVMERCSASIGKLLSCSRRLRLTRGLGVHTHPPGQQIPRLCISGYSWQEQKLERSMMNFQLRRESCLEIEDLMTQSCKQKKDTNRH